MNALINAALSRIRSVVLLFALAMLAGISAMNNLPKESFPDITIPMIYISVRHEGISPEDADRILYSPLHKELKSLDGLKEIIATSAEGHLSVQLEFTTDIDIDAALIDVREAVDAAKGELPQATDEPIVKEINLSLFPVMVVGLAGNVDERVLFAIAKDLKEKVEGLDGVLEAKIQGNREELAEIVIDPNKLDSYNIDQNALYSLINNNNQLVAAGNLDTGSGRFAVKVPGLIESTDDILNMPVKVDGETVVRFRDIAIGQRTYKDPTSKASINGKPALALEISKRVGSNLIKTIDEVKILVAEQQTLWPKGIEVSFNQDQSKEIKRTLDDLFNNVFFATILVMIIIVWSLGVRSSILVGLAIPGSFLLGMLTLSIMGYTLNMVVLFALILSIGMLVDGAIVVTEYADRRMAEGVNKLQAFKEASQRMAWPITASTATTLAVFLPLLVWPDTVGEFMKFIPITVIITLSASLLMALIVIPAIGAWLGKAGAISSKDLASLRAAEEGRFDEISGFTGKYISALKVFIKYPKTTLVGIIGLMFLTIFMYGKLGQGVEFFPEADAEIALVDVRARGNLSLQERDALVKNVEKRLYDMEEIRTLYTSSFIKPPRGGSSDLVGRIQLELEDWQIRRPAKVILEDIRERTADIPGIIIETNVKQDGPAGGPPIQLEIMGDYQEVLFAVVEKIRAELEKDPELRDIKDSRPLEGIEWEFLVDRENASRMGASIASVGNMIKMVTSGLQLGSYRPDDADDEVDIRLRFPTSSRTLDQMDQLRISYQGQLIPISTFTEKVARPQSGNLVRNGSKYRYMINADVIEGVNDAKKRAQIASVLSKTELPIGVTYQFKGDAEKMVETMGFLGKAFILAIFMMAIILITQFNSIYRAGLVLSAIVLSFAGVFLGLMIRGEPFGIVMSGVGMIALAGIVVNNNIVLIDTYSILRREGMAPVDAALRTGAQRLRPVLLTTITTICGLIPMVYQLNIDLIGRELLIDAPSSQWWTQLSTAIAGGLAFATVLTLILTPCLLVLNDQKKYRKEQLLLSQNLT
ncbi:efflux RND transporter permease subunit [Oceaniserpentilla sp. 4NH20-0058]|uniref:efflux RND transporter permease subunit n=1 Tax=Oceaniserpentilla sp. 4NH20-0058 TaxID=3127660 RepID=UPI003109EE23